MIEVLSKKVVDYLIRSETITDTVDDREFYQYGVEITISSILGLLLVFVIGSVTSNVFECAVFLSTFVPIRQLTGGYHADTYFKCNFTLCIICAALLLVYNVSHDNITPITVIAISLLSIMIIFLTSPIQNKNKPISKDRRTLLKYLGTAITLVYAIIGNILFYFSYHLGLIIVYTLLIICTLILYAIFVERRCKNEESGTRS